MLMTFEGFSFFCFPLCDLSIALSGENLCHNNDTLNYKDKEKTAAFTAAERRLIWNGTCFELDERIFFDSS